MARRFIGQAVVTIAYRDIGDYAGSISAGGYVWKFDGLGAPKIGFGPGVAYDSPQAYDEMAAAAVSFGSTTSGEAAWEPSREVADAIDEATQSVMDDRGRYEVLRSPRKKNPSKAKKAGKRRIKTQDELTEFLMGPDWKTASRDEDKTVYLNQNLGYVITVRHRSHFQHRPVIIEWDGGTWDGGAGSYFKSVPEALNWINARGPARGAAKKNPSKAKKAGKRPASSKSTITDGLVQSLADNWVNGNLSDVIQKLEKLPRLSAASCALRVRRNLPSKEGMSFSRVLAGRGSVDEALVESLAENWVNGNHSDVEKELKGLRPLSAASCALQVRDALGKDDGRSFERFLFNRTNSSGQAKSNPTRARSPWGKRELEAMQLLLANRGFDPKDAKKLQQEGMGEEELIGRLKHPAGKIGSLEHSHGLKRVARNPAKGSRKAAAKGAKKLTKEQQETAIKMWRAGADSHADGENFEFELTETGHVFVTGTIYNGRRVTEQVGWDEKGPYVWNGDKYRFYDSERRPQGDLLLDRKGWGKNPLRGAKKPACAKSNPAKGKAVAKHGGYRWGTTYEIWGEEDLEAGDTDRKGWEWEYEDNGPYKSLADLLQDIPSHDWLEWSDSRPAPRSWIMSQDEENYRTGDRTQYALFIEHADGTDLTQSEVNFVDSKLFGARKKKSR